MKVVNLVVNIFKINIFHHLFRSKDWEGQGTLVFGLSLVYTAVYTSMCVGLGLLATVDWREVWGPWSMVSAY